LSLAACQIYQNPTEIPSTKDLSSFPTLIASPSLSDLEGVTWILGTYQDPKGNSINPISGTSITATIENGEISGEAGCNIYGGGLTQINSDIQVEDLFVTEKYCLEFGSNPSLQYQQTVYSSGSKTVIETNSLDKSQKAFLMYNDDVSVNDFKDVLSNAEVLINQKR